MPAMSSASEAVTSPSRSRTRRYAREERRREREAPVEEEEDDRRAEERERVLEEARQPLRDEAIERLDVVRESGDDRAGPVALVAAQFRRPAARNATTIQPRSVRSSPRMPSSIAIFAR